MLIGTFSTDSSRRVAVTTTSSRVGSLAAVVSACATVTEEIPVIQASAQRGPADRTQSNIDSPPYLGSRGDRTLEVGLRSSSHRVTRGRSLSSSSGAHQRLESLMRLERRQPGFQGR